MSVTPSPPERKWPQYLFAFVCNLCTMSYGLHLGWASPLSRKFMTPGESPLGSEVPAFTRYEWLWVSSIPAIFQIVASFVYGITLSIVGRKWTLFIATITNIVCVIILLCAKNVTMIYVARGLGGFAAAIFLMVPIYVNEIVEDEVWGRLGSLTSVFINAGIVFAYIFGTYTSYLVLNLVILAFPVIFLIFFYWIPRTPYYIVMIGNEEEAVRSLQLLRGGTKEKNIEVANRLEKVIDETRKRKRVSPLLIMKQKAFLHGMFIILGLLFIQQFVGNVATTTFAQQIYQNVGTTLGSDISTIITSIVQLCGSVSSSFLIDKLGRRCLLLISNSLVCLSMTAFAVYMWLRQIYWLELDWLPTTCMAFYSYFYSLGSGSVVYVMLPELFSPQAKPYASAICGCWVGTLSFIILRFFLVLVDAITYAGVFTLFAFVGLFGVFFTFFFVTETKGKPMAEIMAKLEGTKIDQEGNKPEKNQQPLRRNSFKARRGQ